MREHVRVWLAGTVLIGLVGCAASGEVVPVDIRAKPAASMAHGSAGDGLRLAILPLDDNRKDRKNLASRSHIFGGETYFNTPGGDAGLLVAQAMAEYLLQAGWQAWLAKPAVTVPGEGAEVILSGQVEEFGAQARSRFFSTEVMSAIRVTVQAKNVSDGSVLKLTMTGSGSQPVFWFESDDVQNVLNEAIKNSVDRFLANTRVENRKLRTTE